MKKMIRAVSALLVLAMLAALAGPASAADSATGAAIQLSKTEGTVAVSKSSGKKLSVRTGMRLYNGYHVTTEAKSYAWINLDDTKLIKEDASSEIEVRKSGRKLEVNLTSGAVFFNVTQDLEEDETLNISTSTMVVGIRGTSGWVRIIDRWTTQVCLTEGTAQCVVTDPVTGQLKSAWLRGGDVAQCLVYPQDRAGDKCDITMARQTVSGIPGFVLTDLVRDVPLCDKILEDSGLDILAGLAQSAGEQGDGRTPDGSAAAQAVIQEAERRQAQDEAQTDRKLAEIQREQREQESHISQNPVWDKEQTPSNSTGESSSGGNSGSGSGGSTGPVTPPQPAGSTMKLTDAQVQALLNSAGSVTVRPSLSASGGKDNVLEIDTGLSVAAGKSLTLQPGVDVEVYSGRRLQVDGTMHTGGSLANSGTVAVTSGDTLRVSGNFANSGTLSVTAAGRTVAEGTFSSTGTLSLTPGARVQAKRFDIAALPPNWSVSAAADSEGFYSLVYSAPPAARNITFDANGGTVDGAPAATYRAGTDGILTDWPADPAYGSLFFEGWFHTDGTKVDQTTIFEESLTVYARWSGWYYDEPTKTLTIAGTGPMSDTKPWLDTCQATVETAIIKDGVTSIGVSAFFRCGNLTSVTVPEGITEIKGEAFAECGSLENVTIPDSVESIEIAAFRSCTSLTSINIPNSVTSLDDSVFGGCIGLTSVTIPNSITSIKDNVFNGCTHLISVTLPDNLESIGNHAFDFCADLKTITIPSTVTSIGEAAFAGCAALTSINIPNSVTSMGTGAFSTTGLTSVTIPGSIQAIPAEAFSNCQSLASVTISDGVTSMGHSAFSVCSDLTTITIPEGITSIPATAFAGCSALTNIVIPNGVTSIGAQAFEESGVVTITIPGSLESFGGNVFQACTSLKDIYFLDTREKWNARGFGDYGATVHCIDDLSGYSVLFDANGGKFQIADDPNVGQTSVRTGEDGGVAGADWPANPTRTAEDGTVYAFDGWYTAAGGGEKVDGNHVFTADATLYAHWTVSGDGWTYNDSTKTLTITKGEVVKEYPSPASVPWNAYKPQVETVNIESGGETIGKYSIALCEALTSVTIGSGVKTIQNQAFEECYALTTVTIPASMTQIQSTAFLQCIALQDIYFGGTKAQWNAIEKSSDAIPDSATVHCTDGDITP